jgi:5-methylthioribose kinase
MRERMKKQLTFESLLTENSFMMVDEIAEERKGSNGCEMNERVLIQPRNRRLESLVQKDQSKACHFFVFRPVKR